MFKLLNNLSIRTRTTLSSGLFILTLLAMTDMAFNSIQDSVDFSAKEGVGNRYQQSAVDILSGLTKLRTAAAVKSAGGNAGDLNVLTNQIDASFETLKKASIEMSDDLKLDIDNFKEKSKDQLAFGKLSNKWQETKTRATSGNITEADAALSAMITDIKDLISYTGDSSNLILDPDLDTYYLMDVTLLALPQTIQRLSEVGSKAFQQTLNGYGISRAEEVESAVNARMLAEADIARIVADIDISLKEDPNFQGVSPTYKAAIEPALNTYVEQNKKLQLRLEAMSRGEAVKAADFLADWTGASQAAIQLWNVSSKELGAMIQTRVDYYEAQQRNALIISFAGVVLSMLFFQFVIQTLVTPLSVLVKDMSKVAEGHDEVVIPYMDAKSEVGEIARALNVFRENSLKNKSLEADKIITEERSQEEKRTTVNNLADSFQSRIEGIIKTVANSSADLANTAQNMSRTVMDSTALAQESASNASETYQNVQSVASAAEEMSATIQEISSQTQNANSLISDSVEKVRSADTQAVALRQSSHQVRSVVQLISNISNQINLLALNATIESARAGEAGKGFAVVANEVRNLAGQTDKSIQDIERVITEMAAAADGVITSLASIKASVDKIYVSSCGVASAVEEQSAVVNDIAQNMNLAAHKTQSVKESVTIVSSLSEQSEESSRNVLGAAQDLSQQAEYLQSAVGLFISSLRTG